MLWCIFYGHGLKENESRQLEDFLQSAQSEAGTFTGLIIKKSDGPGLAFSHARYYVDYEVHARTGEFVEINPCIDPPPYMDLTSMTLFLPLLNLKVIPSFLFQADANASCRGLIRGSFTQTHLAFLRTLLHSGQLLTQMRYRICFDPGCYMTYSQHALQQGIHTALTTINPRVLDILLKFDEALDRDASGGNTSRYKAESNHFRTAAEMHINNNPKYKKEKGGVCTNNKVLDDALLCFCLLLYSSPETIPYDDPAITQFAKDVGGAFGEWLLDYVIDLDYFPPGDDIDEDDYEYAAFKGREPAESSRLGLRYAQQVLPTRDLFKIPIVWMKEEFLDNHSLSD